MRQRLSFHSQAVWPPPLLVVLFAVPYGIISGSLWLLRHVAPDMGDTNEIVVIRSVMIGAAAGLYALFRLQRFHPACNYAYRSWLKMTPWTAAKPLPLGPIHPVWQDAAVIGSLTALIFWNAHGAPTWPILVFGVVYLAGLSVLLAVTRTWWHSLALGFLWPALMLPQVAGIRRYFVVGIIMLVIWHGHRRSLAAFPWDFLKRRVSGSGLQTDIRIDIAMVPAAPGVTYNLGWPFHSLSPKVHPPSISLRTTAALSLLFGWWSFCVVEASNMDPLPELILVFAILTGIGRLATYCSGCTPSFNIWGRISSGRIIVPGFDQVFLTPLALVLVAMLGEIVIRRSGSWYPVTEAVVFGMTWYVLLGGGPTRRNWMLTGQYRIQPLRRTNANARVSRLG